MLSNRILTMACFLHHTNLVSFTLGQLSVTHKAFSFGEKNDEL